MRVSVKISAWTVKGRHPFSRCGILTDLQTCSSVRTFSSNRLCSFCCTVYSHSSEVSVDRCDAMNGRSMSSSPLSRQGYGKHSPSRMLRQRQHGSSSSRVYPAMMMSKMFREWCTQRVSACATIFRRPGSSQPSSDAQIENFKKASAEERKKALYLWAEVVVLEKRRQLIVP